MYKKLVVLITCIALTGCMTTTGGQPRSYSDKQIAAQGAGLGALVGAIAGAALAGPDKRAQGALIGAAVGGLFGTVAGWEVAKRKRKFATEEAFLNDELQLASQYNQVARKHNRSVRKSIASLDRRSRSLSVKYKTGSVSKSKMTAERNKVRKMYANNNKVLGTMKKEYGVKVAVLDDQKKNNPKNKRYIRKLQSQVNTMKKNITSLQKSANDLARIDSRLSA